MEKNRLKTWLGGSQWLAGQLANLSCIRWMNGFWQVFYFIKLSNQICHLKITFMSKSFSLPHDVDTFHAASFFHIRQTIRQQQQSQYAKADSRKFRIQIEIPNYVCVCVCVFCWLFLRSFGRDPVAVVVVATTAAASAGAAAVVTL